MNQQLQSEKTKANASLEDEIVECRKKHNQTSAYGAELKEELEVARAEVTNATASLEQADAELASAKGMKGDVLFAAPEFGGDTHSKEIHFVVVVFFLKERKKTHTELHMCTISYIDLRDKCDEGLDDL